MAESSNTDADAAASPVELFLNLLNTAEAARLEELYNRALNANVHNFVTVKLSGRENWPIWHVQMSCLIIVYMRGLFSSESGQIRELSDNLLKGWIISSIDQKVLKSVGDRRLQDISAWDIYGKLEKLYARRRRTVYTDPDVDAAKRVELLKNINIVYSKYIGKKMQGSSDVDDDDATLEDMESDINMEGSSNRDRDAATLEDMESNINMEGSSNWDPDAARLNEMVGNQVFYFNIYNYLYTQGRVVTVTTEETEIRDRMLIDVSPNDKESTELMKELLNATMEGSWWKAKAILKNHKDAATKVINNNGDTMLHIAVKEGKNYFVNQLLNFIKEESKILELLELRNSEGNTALFTAAIVDNKQAAELLVSKSNKLLNVLEYRSNTPLALAYISGQINTFLYLLGVTRDGQGWLNSRDASRLGVHRLVAKATSTKQYNLALKLVKIPQLLALAPKNDNALMALTTDFPPELGFWEALIYPSTDGVRQNIVKRSSLLLYSFENLYIKAQDSLWAIRNLLKKTDLFSISISTFIVFIVGILLVPVAVFCLIYLLIRIVIFALLLPLVMLYPYLWKGLVYAGLPIKHIEKKKRDHEQAIEVLKRICDEMNKKVTRENVKDHYGRPILEAARVDACEVVVQILRGCEYAQLCVNEKGHDVFQLAILNRSEKVYNRLCPGIKHRDSLRTNRDGSDNWLTHLAAKAASSIVLSRTTGAALQLQRELQWHEEVKKLMRPSELTCKNFDMETSDMVFTREHAELLKNGEQWMKTSAESCSITAALIVTIVFAAAITVPGGSNQETGIPLFKKEIAFIIFAVCDALSLFTAATALLVFLSILTTRFAEKDFLVSLPRQLIIGLCALFISTTAMMIAFGAILFLVFCDQRPWMLAPIGLFACLPISVIVTLQLPLLIDLFQSTYISRFGKQKSH